MDTEPPAFEITIRVEPGDIDALGHANNVAYVRWVQDVAVAHWRGPTGGAVPRGRLPSNGPGSVQW